MLTNFRLLLVFQNRPAQLRSQNCAENRDKRLASGAAQDSMPDGDSLLLAIAILFLLHQCGHRQSLGSPFFLDFALGDNFLLLDGGLGLLASHFALV